MNQIRMIVIAERDLSARRDTGQNNPYIKFYWGGRKYKTTTKASTCNPYWDEMFNLPYEPCNGPHNLKIELWDRTDSTHGRTGIYVGSLAVDFSHIDPGASSDGWYALNNMAGDIRLRLSMNPDQGHHQGHHHCHEVQQAPRHRCHEAAARHCHAPPPACHAPPPARHHCHEPAVHSRPCHAAPAVRHVAPARHCTPRYAASAPRVVQQSGGDNNFYNGLGGFVGAYQPPAHELPGLQTAVPAPAPSYFVPPTNAAAF
eukprot:Selendium_serpulae@DN6359_c0_g2_i12.p1